MLFGEDLIQRSQSMVKHKFLLTAGNSVYILSTSAKITRSINQSLKNHPQKVMFKNSDCTYSMYTVVYSKANRPTFC